MAEAEGECEEGKRLVIDTILNRVDSISFPNTVYEVVYQPSQFSSMWNGRVDRCYIDDYICQLVEEELVTEKITMSYSYQLINMETMEHLCFRLETTIFQVENRKENCYACSRINIISSCRNLLLEWSGCFIRWKGALIIEGIGTSYQ